MALTGTDLPSEAFELVRSEGTIDDSAMRRLMAGEVPAYLIRGFMSAPVCDAVVRNFWQHPFLGRRPDGVEGYYVGAFHFGKSLDRYLHDVAGTQEHVTALFSGTEDPAAKMEDALRGHFARRSVSYRPSEHSGQPAGRVRALAWASPGKYLLDPHDDVGQLRQSSQRGFEIQHALGPVISANMYVKAPPRGGELILFNWKPDDPARESLGISESGFPYPPSDIANLDYLSVRLEPGDVCLLDGRFIHAVSNHEPPLAPHDRLILTFFFAALSADTVIRWT
jgi:hypothetical protein